MCAAVELCFVSEVRARTTGVAVERFEALGGVILADGDAIGLAATSADGSTATGVGGNCAAATLTTGAVSWVLMLESGAGPDV